MIRRERKFYSEEFRERVLTAYYNSNESVDMIARSVNAGICRFVNGWELYFGPKPRIFCKPPSHHAALPFGDKQECQRTACDLLD